MRQQIAPIIFLSEAAAQKIPLLYCSSEQCSKIIYWEPNKVWQCPWFHHSNTSTILGMKFPIYKNHRAWFWLESQPGDRSFCSTFPHARDMSFLEAIWGRTGVSLARVPVTICFQMMGISSLTWWKVPYGRVWDALMSHLALILMSKSNTETQNILRNNYVWSETQGSLFLYPKLCSVCLGIAWKLCGLCILSAFNLEATLESRLLGNVLGSAWTYPMIPIPS